MAREGSESWKSGTRAPSWRPPARGGALGVEEQEQHPPPPGSSLTTPLPVPRRVTPTSLTFGTTSCPAFRGPMGPCPLGRSSPTRPPPSSLRLVSLASPLGAGGSLSVARGPPCAHSASPESPTSLPQVPSTLQPTLSRQLPGPTDPF